MPLLLAFSLLFRLLSWGSELDRISLGAATIDRFLESIGLDPNERRKWYQQYATKKGECGAEYRERKEQLMQLFLRQSKLAQELDAAVGAWAETLRIVGTHYNSCAANNSLTRPKSDIYRSLVHMHCNRLGLNLDQEAQAIALATRAFDAAEHLSRDERT